MTHIDFYHGVQDKIQAAARLIGELYAQDRQVLVYAPAPATATQIDRLLWTQPATGFLPHCWIGTPLAAQTPILIGDRLGDDSHHDVLVNLDGDLPPAFSRFDRLIEIVGADETDRAPARARFKFYRDRGYPLETHELNRRT